MSVFRRAMLYLGLGADEDYDEYAKRAQDRPQPPRVAPPRPVPGQPTADPVGSVRTINPEPSVRPVPTPEPAPAEPPHPSTSSSGVVRTVTVPSRAKPTVITPRSYNDAKQIGDTFKSRQPVIINLQDLRTEVAHRLVDFAAGLTFALDGAMEKVTQNVFLLTPKDMEVDDDERRRLTERGLGD